MRAILEQLAALQKQPIAQTIERRLADFSAFKEKNSSDWFNELCFCILTGNAKAATALAIEKEMGHDGFHTHSQSEICACLRQHAHRFHNNKSRYIVEARMFVDVKERLRGMDDREAREWLATNVNGLGMKEASHFLRNVGYTSVAIVDRHIIRGLLDAGLLKVKPKTISRKTYLEIEQKLERIAEQAKMTLAELDLYLWYLKTGRVWK